MIQAGWKETVTVTTSEGGPERMSSRTMKPRDDQVVYITGTSVKG